MYATALLRCTDPDMGHALEHRVGYMKKLCKQRLQGYTPQFQRLSANYWGTSDSNALRVAKICDKLTRHIRKSQRSAEETYTELLVTAIANGDLLLELEALKSLGDLFLEKAKTTSKVSQFSSAAAMYIKALKICEDPDTKQTLHHRISTGSKRKAARGSFAAEPVKGDRLADSQYSDYLREGESTLAKADLHSAEQHFAAALKMVHLRDPTAQQYQREVEPLCKLGDVYSKRGQQTGDGGDFVKAAALYNAAIARSKDEALNGNIVVAIEESEKLFLRCILGIQYKVSQDESEKHKKQLNNMRDQVKLEMETIDQQLDPYVHDDNNPCVKEVEAKRAQAVRQLFENIAQQRKEFISLLVEECIGLMGPPPCKYALIGLGSQATGLVTPYSDLEFAILVEDEGDECLKYFRTLTHFLHLKVVNLGETILPAVGIKSLNDFYSKDPHDSWYYDSVTPPGFAFDGSMPKASKTPLGMQGTMNKPPSELICTPSNMVLKLKNDITLYLKEGYHLATILRNPCLIAGDQGLIDTYMAITVEILQADGGKMAQQLAQETMKEDIKSYGDEGTVTAKIIDVKKAIYRFPALTIDYLALSSCILPTTVWTTIEEMQNQQVISPNNAHHITVVTSISAELRLRTYIANGGQNEKLSALASMERALHDKSSLQADELQTNDIKPVFYLPNEKQLFRYYQTAVPLKRALSKGSGNKPVGKSFPDFYDTSPRVQGIMYCEICKYRLAINYFNDALKKADGINEKMLLLSDIGGAWYRVGDNPKAISYNEQALEMYTGFYGQGTASPDIAILLNNLGEPWYHEGDYKKAIYFLEQALQMYRTIYGHSAVHTDVAMVLNNLGKAWDHLGDYRKATSYLEQALQMAESIHGTGTSHPRIAAILNNLVHVWGNLGDQRKAISYLGKVLNTYRNIYGRCTAHPNIASSLNNLGMTWRHLGNYNKAINYLDQALQMHRVIYGQTANPEFATLLNNIGSTWHLLGEYRKEINYLEQAIQMYKGIHGQHTKHPDIAMLLVNLGEARRELGDPRTAISYYSQALQMYGSIYGLHATHLDIAVSLNNMALAWDDMGEHRRAISHYEQALQMYRNIYGQNTTHPDIAMSLDNMGGSWQHLGNFRKAITYHEQALEVYRSIYGEDNAAHPDIAKSFNNMGTALQHMGDYRKAINYLEQALQMYKGIYSRVAAHSDIATLFNNLGESWHQLGDHRKAISYHEQALQMTKDIHGESTPHPQIALSLSNLGYAWSDLGDQRAAIDFNNEALQMFKCIFGQSTAHPYIANSLNNLGMAWYEVGDYRKAISYHEKALEMRISIHGQGSAHYDIATSLNNLGQAYSNLGDQKKAISYLKQALHMYTAIYGHDTAHPDIAMLLNNLGLAWDNLGDYKKAIRYIEQALQMMKSVYGPLVAHPHIATFLNNLAMSWANLNDHRKAISICQEALIMARQIYPQDKNHPLIEQIQDNLTSISAECVDNT
uniref:Protein-PII uridylyltransferase N-terminal domain-containing protein n=1 Tax=Branchiostoma floridae TaxID=7739 RepID=C3XY38_BRAFL|eukprot:XP_002611082.1 hypothetical protein BRAFLDRAFT_70431 [Branchiostoma floridae]